MIKIRQLLVVFFLLLALTQAFIQAQDRRRETTPSGPPPDLTIKRVDVLDNFRVQVIIANDSEGKLLHSFLVVLRIYDSDGHLLKPLPHIVNPPLVRGRDLFLQIETKGQTLFGNRFEVEVDVGKIIAESNENNNRTKRTDGPGVIASKKKEQEPKPVPAPKPAPAPAGDLAVTGISFEKQDGEEVAVVEVKNVDSVPSAKNRKYTLYRITQVGAHRSTLKVVTSGLPSLSPGEEFRWLERPLPPKVKDATTYVWRFVFDEADSNPDNDRFERTIKVPKSVKLD